MIDWPKQIEDVVVVIFNEEVDLFKLQLRTFDTFLERCNLHIVINELDIRHAHKEIKKYITQSKHNIKVWSREDILGTRNFEDVSGWSTQQLLKLLIPLKRDWIVFDAKDLLIRPVQLIDLDRKQKKDYEDLSLGDPQANFYQGVIDLCQKHGFDKTINPANINMNHTPRVITNGIIRKIMSMFKTKNEFIDWFLSFRVQGEFILHDYVGLQLDVPQKLRFPQSFNAGIWSEELFNSITFDKIPPTTCVYKCHRRVYNIKENKIMIDAWLGRIIETYVRYQNAINDRT